jgi:hypothetical protein
MSAILEQKLNIFTRFFARFQIEIHVGGSDLVELKYVQKKKKIRFVSLKDVTLSGGPEASSGAWVQTCSIF